MKNCRFPPSVWWEAWPCANARKQACCSKFLPCSKRLAIFCQSPTKSRYRIQQGPIFLLKCLLLSLLSGKEQLEKRGIKPANKFSYRLLFTTISLHSCTCISQPDIYSCCLMQPTAHLSLTHNTHALTLPSSSSKDCSAFNQRKIIIIKIAIIKKIYSIHFLLVYYISIFCTWPKSSLYLHSDMEGLLVGSLVLLALSGEFKPTFQSSSFSFPFF